MCPRAIVLELFDLLICDNRPSAARINVGFKWSAGSIAVDWPRDDAHRVVAILAAWARGIHRSRRGSVAIIVAITMPIAIGMLALGSEIVFLLYKQRQMQSAADAAALGGATALQAGHPTLGIEARGTTGFLGFVDGAGGVSVAVNRPPLSGVQAGNSSAVEVIIAQPYITKLVSLIYSGPFTVSARAVAIVGGGTACVLQLDSTASPGVTMNNGAVVNLTACGLVVDSTSTIALSMSGGAQLNATAVSVVGQALINNGATINPSSALKTSQSSVADPYASVAPPSYSGCSNGTNKSYTHSNAGLQTVNPGVWCNGVSFTNDAIIKMNPGVYVIDRGTFSVGGAVVMTGTGVTIFLTSSTGSSYATATVNNGANVTLSAPTSGATAGIVFFGDRRAPKSNTIDLSGGAQINVSGALYFPTQKVLFQNGVNNPSGCTQLIAGTLQLVGGSKFQNNCPAGISGIGSSRSTLVE